MNKILMFSIFVLLFAGCQNNLTRVSTSKTPVCKDGYVVERWTHLFMDGSSLFSDYTMCGVAVDFMGNCSTPIKCETSSENDDG